MRSKYHNTRVISDGERFDSKAEFKRFQDLKLLERAGRIRDLKRQVTFPLVVNGVHVANYIADFTYEDTDNGVVWETTVEDVKGVKTDVYKLKKKLMHACLGIHILETK